MKKSAMILPTLFLACLISCNDEDKRDKSSVQDLRKQDASALEQRNEKLPEVVGDLTLNYGDESVASSGFDKSGCNLIFASVKQKVSMNLIGSGDDEGKRLLISFPHPQDGVEPLTGSYSTADGARFAANGYVGGGLGAMSLQDGILTITECDKASGKVRLSFEGKGGSLGQAAGNLPSFSGTLNVENLQVVRY